MTYLLPILLFLALVAALRWLTRSDDDAAAGVLLGPDSGRAALRAASPALLRVCGWCDGLLHDEPVTLCPRQKITLTHGICPRCEARQLREIDRIPTSETQTPVLTH